MLMTRATHRTLASIILTLLWAVSGCWPARVSAQTPSTARAQAARQATPPGAQAPIAVSEQDAAETRQQLQTLMDRYPPALGRVLKLDPTLLATPEYLAPYPALAEFLARHPEVVHNSGYYLSFVRGAGDSAAPFETPRTESGELWRQMMEGLAIGTVFLTVMGTFAWLVRLLVDYRRWSRLAKVQSDAHNKLLDRFTANDELLSYMRTPAGSRFLESAPIALDPGHRQIGAPFGRILWSIQAGVVLAAGGLGLQYVSSRVQDSASQPLFALGVLALALGAGFIVSAVVAYYLSRRLGLFEPAAAAIGASAAGRSGPDQEA
jgi:hypothetical protein